MRLSHDYEIIIHVHSNWKMMQIFHTVNYSEIFFTYFSSSIDFHPSFKFNTSLQQCPRRLTQFTVKKLYCPIAQRKPQTSSYSGRIILLFCRDKRRFCDFFFEIQHKIRYTQSPFESKKKIVSTFTFKPVCDLLISAP